MAESFLLQEQTLMFIRHLIYSGMQVALKRQSVMIGNKKGMDSPSFFFSWIYDVYTTVLQGWDYKEQYK